MEITDDQQVPTIVKKCLKRRVSDIRARKFEEGMKILPPVAEDIRPLKPSREDTITPDANNTIRSTPANLPKPFLFTGDRELYLKNGIPLYEASIKCDWDAAEKILKADPYLVRYSLTENGETALHVAASAKVSKKEGKVFVEKLVGLMEEKDLALENENFNTALYLASAAGNLETVKIMVEKNKNLLTIPSGKKQMLPLYAAVLLGTSDVVQYIYENSNDLCDAGWTDVKRGWLLEKCIENNFFDIALKIVKKYPQLGSGNLNVLAVLARKPEAFHETQSTMGGVFKLGKYIYSVMFSTNQPSKIKHPEAGGGSVPIENLNQKPEASSKKSSNIFWRTINSVFALGSSKVEAPANESIALQLLRIIWEDVAKKSKNEIDRILRGPQDLNKQGKSAAKRAFLVKQLQDLISEHLYEMNILNRNIIKAQQHMTENDTNTVSGETDQSFDLIKRISKSLVSLRVETQNIIRGSQDSINQDNKPTSGKADQGLELQHLISEKILRTRGKIQNIMNEETLQLRRLQEVISDHIEEMKTGTKDINERPAYSSRVVFMAAKMGNTKFLVELIRQYPDLIWQVNERNQTIFHIAVRYRHTGIYNLLYEIGAMKDMITPLRDPNENNMLHLVGMCAKRKQLKDVPGVALQMQRELLWFQEVKEMISPSYREQKNKDGLTPQELFTKEHQEMVTEGEKWIKKIAAQCIVVAALVATMVFTAAFTVPGGYDQRDGIPILHSKLSFQIFVVADAISLFLSTASILHMFLSVFTSRYGERDFLASVPKKLMLGLSFLFLSITSMMIAFCTGFFILYHKGLLWMPILISVFALIPFSLYMLVQKSLFIEVIPLIFSSRTHLFNPKKRVLYYENPKV